MSLPKAQHNLQSVTDLIDKSEIVSQVLNDFTKTYPMDRVTRGIVDNLQ